MLRNTNCRESNGGQIETLRLQNVFNNFVLYWNVWSLDFSIAFNMPATHASHTCQPHMPATHATTFIYHSKKQSLSENCTCVCMCVCVCMVVCALTCFVAGSMLGAPTDTVCGIDSQAQLWAVTVVDRAR